MSNTASKYARLWQYLKPYWGLEALTFVTMLVLTALAIALPIAIQYMIDTLIPGLVSSSGPVDFRPVIWFALFLVGIYLANVLVSWLRDYLAGYIGAHIIQDIRSQVFGHLQRLSLGFFQKHQTGELMSRLLSDVSRIQDLLSVTLLVFLTSILMLIGILAYLLHMNWILTLVAVIPVPLTIIFANYFGKKLNGIAYRMQSSLAALSARLQETLLSIKTVKAFGQEEQEDRKVGVVLSELTGIFVRHSVVNSLAVNLVQFINMIGPIVVLAWGVYLVVVGSMKLGELIAFYILLTYLYSPIHGLAETNLQVQSAMASVDRVFECLDQPPAVVEAAQPVVHHSPRGEIAFENISFGYPDSGFRIRDLSLTIEAGEKVAFVGPSGSGKTTLANLVMRFFDPDQGKVTLDGVDLRVIEIRSLRNSIALVDQDPLLFRASVHDNLAYGHQGATRDQVVKAARNANIHEFIVALPQGYDSEIGERGVTVSGGEKQRLCLARAILTDPKILILDEATSALDSNSELLIQETLGRILVGKTAIIIAHRLSTVQHADRIVVLEGGRIIDQGTHDELSTRCPMYRELAAKQLLV